MLEDNYMLQKIFDNYPGVVFLVDKEGHIVYGNLALFKELHSAQASIGNLKIHDLFPSKRYNWSEILNQDEFSRIATWFNTLNGENKYVEVLLTPFEINSHKYSLCYIKNKQKNIQVITLLDKYERDLYNLVEKSPHIILKFDDNRKCMYVNKAWEDLTGFSRLIILGKTPLECELQFGENSKILQNMLIEVLERGGIRSNEFEMKNPQTKKIKTFRCNMIPEDHQEPKGSGVLMVAYDITRQKKKEQELLDQKAKAEQNDRLKTSFLAVLNHEIRTPLNAIVGFSTILNDTVEFDSKYKDYLALIKESGLKLANILDDMLDLSRIESGTVILEYKNVDLRELVEDMYAELGKMIEKSQKNNLKVELFVGETIANTEWALDRKYVKMLVNYLLNNAVKFTEKGKITLGIHLINDSVLEFFVKDTGCGIKLEEQKKIFEPFIQADREMNREHEGLGIGLTTVNKLSELMGGKIEVRSEVGKGSIFSFQLLK